MYHAACKVQSVVLTADVFQLLFTNKKWSCFFCADSIWDAVFGSGLLFWHIEYFTWLPFDNSFETWWGDIAPQAERLFYGLVSTTTPVRGAVHQYWECWAAAHLCRRLIWICTSYTSWSGLESSATTAEWVRSSVLRFSTWKFVWR